MREHGDNIKFKVTVQMEDDYMREVLEVIGFGKTAEEAFKQAVGNIGTALSKSESEK